MTLTSGPKTLNFTIGLLTFLLLTGGFSLAPASALATTPFQQKLEEAIQNFKKRKLAANKYVIESFRNERRKLFRNRSLTEATRAEYKKRLTATFGILKGLENSPTLLKVLNWRLNTKQG